MHLPIVASLWIGGRLSYLERLCLTSFRDHGHRTILYAYGDVDGVPDGVEVLDANLIYPSTDYICHTRSGSPAIHADAFRYRMLEVQNVVWVDADMLCMKPWDFGDQWVFGWEKPGSLVCNAVLGLPRFSRTLARLNAFCRDPYPVPPWAGKEERTRLLAEKDAGRPVHVSDLKWGVWGPAALTHFLNETGEMRHVLPQNAFYPIPFRDRRDLLSPRADIEAGLGEGCYGVHLWNRRLRRRLVTHHGGVPEDGSFLARMLDRHGVSAHDFAIPDEPPVRADAAEPAPPRPLSRKRVMRIQRASQSPEAQRRIDELERRTAALAGALAPPETPLSRDRILVVTSMKNEAPFILEWVAYHRAIGVTDFLVYTNDCSDGTDALLDRIAMQGFLERRDNPWRPESGKKPQHVALKDAATTERYREADWVLTIDVDEFVNVHVGDGTIPALLDAANNPNVLSLTWKFFGNAGIARFEDRPVTEQFVRCAPEFLPKPRLGWGFKTMVHKTAPYGRIGVHRPLDLDETRSDEVRWVNGSGRVMPEMLKSNSGWRSTKRSVGYRLATLNHYVLRSAESFLVKRERGRINHADQDQGLDYWMRRNYGTETDARIQSRLPAMRVVLDELRADTETDRLHRAAVAWHARRIVELKRDPDYRALFDRIADPGLPDALDLGPDFGTEDAGFRVPIPAPPASAATAPVHERFGQARSHAAMSSGFLWEGPENALMFAPGSGRLVVTFDNLSSVRTDAPRWPWGWDVLRKGLGCSVLGVMATKRNWFRHDFVHDAFDALRAQGFFSRFVEILFYGASMGGFGALTYAAAAPGARVLAIAPQSTLDRRILPGEDRWGWTARLDWDGRYADAAEGAAAADRAFVVSDPYFAPDVAQVSRLTGPNVTRLRTPFMGHQLPNAFARMGVLKDLLFAAADGTLSEAQFYHLYRARRDLPRFQHDLLMEAEKRGKVAAAIRVCEYTLRKRDAGNIRRTLERLRAMKDGDPRAGAAA